MMGLTWMEDQVLLVREYQGMLGSGFMVGIPLSWLLGCLDWIGRPKEGFEIY